MADSDLRRLAALAAATALALSAVAGCSLQPGKEAVDDFTTWHAEHPLPGVSTESASANDVLPGVGNATVLLVSDGTSAPEEALEHYCSYVSGTHVYFDLVYPVRPAAEDPDAGTVTVPLPCEEASSFQRPTVVEELDGLEAADLRETPHLSFTTPRTMAAGLRAMRGNYDARELTASTDGVYASLDAAADPAAAAAAADVIALAARWPIKHVILEAGNVNYPAVLNVQATGLKRRVEAEVTRIVKTRGVPKKYAVNVTVAPRTP